MKQNGYYTAKVRMLDNEELIVGFNDKGSLVLRMPGMEPIEHRVSEDSTDVVYMVEDRQYTDPEVGPPSLLRGITGIIKTLFN